MTDALEIIQETGKLKLQNIDDGNLYLLIEELAIWVMSAVSMLVQTI